MNKSFLKWAGGKYRVLPILIPIIEKYIDKNNDKQKFIEPFVGGGTVFLNVFDFKNFIINDSNEKLIKVYIDLKENKELFIKKVNKYFGNYNNKEDFIRLVKKYNKNYINNSELFIYLNKHCFNGLMRFNSSGDFNTPFGSYSNPQSPINELNVFNEKIKNNNVKIYNLDYKDIFKKAKKGDVIYCDPPYIDINNKTNFRQYGAKVFCQKEQENLAKLAKKASLKGITVILSNHFNDITKELYKECDEMHVFDVRRSISSKGSSRSMVKEVIAVYKGLKNE